MEEKGDVRGGGRGRNRTEELQILKEGLKFLRLEGPSNVGGGEEGSLTGEENCPGGREKALKFPPCESAKRY